LVVIYEHKAQEVVSHIVALCCDSSPFILGFLVLIVRKFLLSDINYRVTLVFNSVNLQGQYVLIVLLWYYYWHSSTFSQFAIGISNTS